MSFITKDIAKAFFEFDLTDNKPSIKKRMLKPHNRNLPVAPPLHATEEVKGNNQVTFLTLPAKIRLRIYDELLVSRFDRTENPSWAVGKTNQKLILLHMIRSPQNRTMEPRILQTCKQIYREANTILYSKNVFAASDHSQMSQLIIQIGPANLKLIKTMRIWVPWMATLAPHLHLLHVLAKEASGLRNLELGWGADLGEILIEGLGKDLDFVRALGKIQGLEQLTIRGYYAKNWPAYLEERMGVQVRAICGHCLEESEPRKKNLSDEEFQNEKFIREWNEREMQAFRNYQEGTEGLIP